MAGQVTSVRQMIDRLIAFDTTSRNSNLNLIHWVRDYLADHGVAATLMHDESGKKASLFATLGPQGDGGIVLSGHSDVVPVDGQDWSSDPWTVDERDGRLYGRGTSDMKSFFAIALALVASSGPSASQEPNTRSSTPSPSKSPTSNSPLAMLSSIVAP